jgi:hypothetical protein
MWNCNETTGFSSFKSSIFWFGQLIFEWWSTLEYYIVSYTWWISFLGLCYLCFLLASTDGTMSTLTPFVHVSFRSPVHWIFFFRSLSLSPCELFWFWIQISSPFASVVISWISPLVSFSLSSLVSSPSPFLNKSWPPYIISYILFSSSSSSSLYTPLLIIIFIYPLSSSSSSSLYTPYSQHHHHYIASDPKVRSSPFLHPRSFFKKLT